MKFHGIHKKWQYKTVTGKYGCFRRPLIHLLRQPDPPSTSRWDDVYCDYHASCAKRMLGLTHLTCSIFTAALTAMPCAHKERHISTIVWRGWGWAQLLAKWHFYKRICQIGFLRVRTGEAAKTHALHPGIINEDHLLSKCPRTWMRTFNTRERWVYTIRCCRVHTLTPNFHWICLHCVASAPCQRSWYVSL